MEFKSLSEIIRYVESALAVQFYSGSGSLRKGVLKIIANVVGGGLYMFSLLAKNIWKNRFVSTCDVIALDGFGAEYGLPHKAPSFARGNISVAFSGTASSITIAADTYFVDPITKLEYRTVVSNAVSSSSSSVNVIAAEPGAEYNVDVGTVLQFRDAVPTGLKNEVTVSNDSANNGIAYGYSVDVEYGGDVQKWGETAEEYRERLLNRIQNPPQGGSENDYRMMAERFNFVSRAYVSSGSPNLNTVAVALANYNSASILVSSEQIAEVFSYISNDTRRNITADVRVFSVNPITYTVKAAVKPYSAKVIASVDDTLKKLVRNVEPGHSITLDRLANDVLANSIATEFSFMSVTRSGAAVTQIALDLDVDDSVAEVALISGRYVGA